MENQPTPINLEVEKHAKRKTVPQTRRRTGDKDFSVAVPQIQAAQGGSCCGQPLLFIAKHQLKTFLLLSVYGHQDTD